MKYGLRITRYAQRKLERLRRTPYYRSIREAILALADNPRPPGCTKVEESEAWRIRIGDYRVLYEIDDAALTITIVDADHRDTIYRRN